MPTKNKLPDNILQNYTSAPNDVLEFAPPLSESWDNFVAQNLKTSLLQSWAWGDFQKLAGRKIARLTVKSKQGQIEAAALLVLIMLPFNFSYAYCPRGPVIKGQDQGQPDPAALKKIHIKITRQARAWNAVFVRIDPPVNPKFFSDYATLGYKKAANEIQPRVTARLNLTQDRDQILAAMKSKTRYNIRLAVRKKIVVRQSISAADTVAFLQLNKQTTARDNFIGHPDNYYRQQFNILGKTGLLKLFVAAYQNKPLAIIAVAWHGRTGIYLHGVSGNRERNRMPTFLAQWEAIKFLQSRGVKWYDFHGVAPDDNPAHPWAGITRFKLGFGAKRIIFMGALDLPLRPFWYEAYRLRLKLKKGDGR